MAKELSPNQRPSPQEEDNTYTIVLEGEALHTLMAISFREHRTVGETLARAIAIGKLITDINKEGGKVIIEKGPDEILII